MPASDFDREELLEDSKGTAGRRPDTSQARQLDWASAVGNSAVQRLARSAAGRRTPVAPDMMPLATGALARQAEDEEEEEGGGAATATAEPAPEAAAPAMPEAGAEPEVGEEELEEEETG